MLAYTIEWHDGFSQMDPNVVREQFALQMQIYALSCGGMVSDSSLSGSLPIVNSISRASVQSVGASSTDEQCVWWET